jgi:S-phase kinase-associated protein 1
MASTDHSHGLQPVLGLDDEDMIHSDHIDLVSSDGLRFSVQREVACMSQLLRTMLEGDSKETEIPLKEVRGSELKKIVEYMNHHHGNMPDPIDRPIKSSRLEDFVTKWDAEFVDVEQSKLFDIILAANYMDIRELLDLGCAKAASLIKGKTPEQIRTLFNLENDLSSEEQEQIRMESCWVSE